MPSTVQVGPATITMNRDDRVLVCQPDGTILGAADDGFFTRDTRFVSGYRLLINGLSPVLLNSAPIRFFSARSSTPTRACSTGTARSRPRASRSAWTAR